MDTRHVEAELIAYLDGELSKRERARIEAHLADCARCRAELAELRALRDEVDATYDAALSPVELSYTATQRIRERLHQTAERPGWWWQLRRNWGVLAQAALALVMIVAFVGTYRTVNVPLAQPQQTLVLGQRELAPGRQAALRVVVRTAESVSPVAGALVSVSLREAPGVLRQVYQGVTGPDGTADVTFTVPEELEGNADLVVETRSDAGRGTVVRPIIVARRYKLLLTPDKPVYRPGQTVHVRALALDAGDLHPATGAPIQLALNGLAGSASATTSDYGVATGELPLPADLAAGDYTLRATLGDTVAERAISVRDEPLPAFRVTLSPEQAVYAPGARLQGAVEASYVFGKPVVDAEVTVRGYALHDGARISVAEADVTTDARGHATFTLNLPANYGADALATLELEAEVRDPAGQKAGVRTQVPITAEPLRVQAVPESGALKPGVENVVYVSTTTPDGRPLATALTVEGPGFTRALTTDAYGLGAFRFSPAEGRTRLQITARDETGRATTTTLTLAAEAGERTLLLRTDRAAYEVGETLRVEALAHGLPDETPIYLDVVREQQIAAVLSAPLEQGSATFALDLDGDLLGSLDLRAYALTADNARIEDHRWVVVDAPDALDVTLAADREVYRPGETAELAVRTTRAAKDAPTTAVVGLSVVDASVYALETQPATFARLSALLDAGLLERRGAVSDPDTLLDAETARRTAQEVAARAAWATAPAADYTLEAQTALRPEVDAARVRTARGFAWGMLLLPLLMSALVVRGLAPWGTLRRALRRVGVGLLIFMLVSPLTGLLFGGGSWLLAQLLGAQAVLLPLSVVVVVLLALVGVSWWRRDARLQAATGLVAAYLVVGAGALLVGAPVDVPTGWLLAGVIAGFLLLIAALALLGQGLLLEGRPGAGWLTTALGLLLIPLALTLAFSPALTSPLTRTLASPELYAGPLSWLTGCAAPEMTGEPTYEPEDDVEEEIVTEEVVVTATPVPTEEPAEEAPVEEPTEVPPEATATSPPAPYPFRQVFPETLYWDPEAYTDAEGRLHVSLPLADSVTTWQISALASTREGVLGAATARLPVVQDFFVDLQAPRQSAVGETITVNATLYNYAETAQTVRLMLASQAGLTLLDAPDAVAVAPDGVATATFTLRADAAGTFALQLTAAGEDVFDAVEQQIVVTAP